MTIKPVAQLNDVVKAIQDDTLCINVWLEYNPSVSQPSAQGTRDSYKRFKQMANLVSSVLQSGRRLIVLTECRERTTKQQESIQKAWFDVMRSYKLQQTYHCSCSLNSPCTYKCSVWQLGWENENFKDDCCLPVNKCRFNKQLRLTRKGRKEQVLSLIHI